ncbi:MAG: UDP-N-acetylmuramate dehydrogenase [Chloroflexota bacterium]|jgi:UDP-N-acetylmuramate dehydrogenase|nr:UDP-N-acetylmuramate dehydrogenase [Chloroflexota bacterium]
MATIMTRSLPAWPGSAAVLADHPLAPLTTFGVGGSADHFAAPESTPDLIALLDAAHAAAIPITVLGEGSNVLIGDAGIRGLTIHNRVVTLEAIPANAVRAGSGVLMGRLAAWSAERGLAGLEFGVGIPGSLGGSVFGNAGCFGVEIKDVLIETNIWHDGAQSRLSNAELVFAYRHSALQALSGTPVVLDAILQAVPDGSEAIRARMTELSRQRRTTQPANPSAGSVFRNPPDDHAGRLIEAAGLKGTRCGNAQISDRHANFITNRGGATAADVAALIHRARAAVADQFNIQLETEIRFIGEGFGASP